VIAREAQQASDLTKNFALQNGDTVYVDRAPGVLRLREVPRGGRLPPGDPTMTVMQAIVAGGGITPRGSERPPEAAPRRRRRQGGVESDAKMQDTGPGRRRHFLSKKPCSRKANQWT